MPAGAMLLSDIGHQLEWSRCARDAISPRLPKPMVAVTVMGCRRPRSDRPTAMGATCQSPQSVRSPIRARAGSGCGCRYKPTNGSLMALLQGMDGVTVTVADGGKIGRDIVQLASRAAATKTPKPSAWGGNQTNQRVVRVAGHSPQLLAARFLLTRADCARADCAQLGLRARCFV